MQKDELGRNPSGFFNNNNDLTKALAFITKHLTFFVDYSREYEEIKRLEAGINVFTPLFYKMKDAYEEHNGGVSAYWSQEKLSDAINNYYLTGKADELLTYFDANPSMAKVIANGTDTDPILSEWASSKGYSVIPATTEVAATPPPSPNIDERAKAVLLIRNHTAFFMAVSNPVNQELKSLAEQHNITESPLLEAIKNAFHNDTDRMTPGWISARKFRNALEDFNKTNDFSELTKYFDTNPAMYKAIANHAENSPDAAKNDPLFAAWMKFNEANDLYSPPKLI